MLLNLYKYQIPCKKVVRYFVGIELNKEITCLIDDRLQTILHIYKGSDDVQFTTVQATPRKPLDVYITDLNFIESPYGTGIKVYQTRVANSSSMILLNPLIIKDLTHRRMVRDLKEYFQEVMDDSNELPNFLILLNMCLQISGLSQVKEFTVMRAINEAKTSKDLQPLCYLWFLLGVDSIYDNLSDSRSESILLVSAATKNLFNTGSF